MSADEPSRPERLLHAAIALGAAVPMLYMGVHERIDYDGWWHVFIARTTPWAQFWRDVHDNAHPPVYYLLLRGAAWLGTERLVYRGLSIAAAAVATYLVGRLAARVYRTPGMAAVCALGFGLAMPTAVMACAVRSYMLSLALLLIAFRLFLDLIDPRGRRGAARPAWFAVAVSAAIATHYSAAFFAVAAAVLPFAYAAADTPYRAWLRRRLPADWRAALAVALPIATITAAVYAVHVSQFAAPMPHTASFHPSAAEWAAGTLRGATAFVARAVVAEIDLFSPVRIAARPPVIQAAVVALLGLLAAALALALRRRADWPSAAAPLATLFLLATLIIAAALLGRYPFGGFLRHQFILFPFVVLVGFGLLDEAVARLGRRRLAVAALAALVLLHAGAQWRRVRFVDGEPASLDVAPFDALFADSVAIYVDRFSVIPLIASRQRDVWAAQVDLGGDIVAVPVRRRDGTQLVLRDMRRWSCDLADPALYRDLRRLIDRAKLPALDLFRLRQDSHLLPPVPREERRQLAETVLHLARGAGLGVERLVLDGPHVYLRLRPAAVAAAPSGARHRQTGGGE